MNRLKFAKLFLYTGGLLLTLAFTVAQADELKRTFGQEITVYKTPTCGCCKEWVSYLKTNGFKVITHDLDNLSQVKAQHGVPAQLQSCHTAVVDGYVVEGHVPADDIWRLLTQRPKVTGITAPGMPQQSPGMYSIEPRDYDVLSFDGEGQVTLFSRY